VKQSPVRRGAFHSRKSEFVAKLTVSVRHSPHCGRSHKDSSSCMFRVRVFVVFLGVFGVHFVCPDTTSDRSRLVLPQKCTVTYVTTSSAQSADSKYGVELMFTCVLTTATALRDAVLLHQRLHSTARQS
jgi:hypothetical protein